MGGLPGSDFQLPADGTLRCPEDHPLSPQERRSEGDGTVRVVSAASMGQCRPGPLRDQCQGHGAHSRRPRRVSAILHPLPDAPPQPVPSVLSPATEPIIWGDWSRRFHRRAFAILTGHPPVEMRMPEPRRPAHPASTGPLARAERAHWRLCWAQRLARHAVMCPSPPVSIPLFGVPDAFARAIGLAGAYRSLRANSFLIAETDPPFPGEHAVLFSQSLSFFFRSCPSSSLTLHTDMDQL